MAWLQLPLFLVGVLAIAATILPLWRTTRWWVRLCDFPRFQIAVLALAILLLTPLTQPSMGLLAWLFLAALAAVVLWQLSWVWPYLPGTPREVGRCHATPDAPSTIGLLTTNVLRTSRGAERLLEIIGESEPDVVLAVETDEWWIARLAEGLQSRYPHDIRYPLSNGYGLALFSRLELVEPSVRFIVDEGIPSIRTGIRLRSGAVVDLYGVHPRPPALQQDSTERDVELVQVGREVKERGRPAIVLGDLNDVAWSRSTLRFTKVGGLLDPRRGRGFYNTYPARLPGLRYPLDYIFNTPHFKVCDMRVLPRFCSDHLPLIVVLSLEAEMP